MSKLWMSKRKRRPSRSTRRSATSALDCGRSGCLIPMGSPTTSRRSSATLQRRLRSSRSASAKATARPRRSATREGGRLSFVGATHASPYPLLFGRRPIRRGAYRARRSVGLIAFDDARVFLPVRAPRNLISSQLAGDWRRFPARRQRAGQRLVRLLQRELALWQPPCAIHFGGHDVEHHRAPALTVAAKRLGF